MSLSICFCCRVVRIVLLALSPILADSAWGGGFDYDDDVYALVSSLIVGEDYVTFCLVQGRCDLNVIDVDPKGAFSPDTHSGHTIPLAVRSCFVVVHRNLAPVPGYSFDLDKLRKEAASWAGHKVLLRCSNAKTTVEEGMLTRIDTDSIYIEDYPPKATPDP